MTSSTIDWIPPLTRACSELGVAHVVFQPVIDLKRGVVSGYELLTRFAGPPFAPPDVWFAAAARHGFAGALEATAVHAAVASLPLLPRNTFLAVNVGPAALDAPEVRRAFGQPASLDRLVIEITEQSEVADYERLAATLAPLRAVGAKVAVDDVGAGHAGLGQVMDVRPEFVKLDRRFVSNIDGDPARVAMLETVGEFASRLDAWVVAEGVERPEELDALVRLSVPLAQGFLLGHPRAVMADVDQSIGSRLRSRGYARLPTPCVGALADLAPVARDHDGREAVARLFSSFPLLTYLPVLDSRQRAVAAIARDAFFRHEHARRAPLRVEPECLVSEVARRAMTRPADHRFDPVVCCDENGRYVGLVPVERLVEELAG